MVTALDKAIDQTIQIAKALPHKDNHKLYTKTVQSIFDDQLKEFTNMNRIQRHNARKNLKKALKQHGLLT